MSILKFRVLLDDPEIKAYRDIEVEETANFESFHLAIIKSFGLRGDQMASFYKSDGEWEKGEEIPLMSMDLDSLSMRDIAIKDKTEGKGSRFFYIYNFLTLWIFYVEVMEISEKVKGSEYPVNVQRHGPNINEDIRDLGFEISELEGEEKPISKESDPYADLEEEFDMEGMDPLDGEFEDIDDYDI